MEPELKFAGYDAVVIWEKADRLVYLWIQNGEVEIRPPEQSMFTFRDLVEIIEAATT